MSPPKTRHLLLILLLSSLATTAWAAPPSEPVMVNGARLPAKQGEVLVRLTADSTAKDIEQLARRNGCNVLYVSDVAPVVVFGTKGKPVDVALAKLRRDDAVTEATPNILVHATGKPTGNSGKTGGSTTTTTTNTSGGGGGGKKARTTTNQTTTTQTTSTQTTSTQTTSTQTTSLQNTSPQTNSTTQATSVQTTSVQNTASSPATKTYTDSADAERSPDVYETDPHAPLLAIQWNLHYANAPSAWRVAEGNGVTVAVLDTGVSPYAFSLDGNVNWELAANFIGGDSAEDDNGHGTHMACQVAAHKGMRGVAPRATIVPVKVLDANRAGTELALVEGLYYAASLEDVQVINLSLTFPPAYVPSRILSEAVDAVTGQGIVVVASTGNDGVGQVGYPAAFPHVIAVGAAAMTGQTGNGVLTNRADYSNFGYGVDILAFGGDMTQDVNEDLIPDGILGQGLPSAGNPLGWILMEGTSPAAAQVSGAAALLLEIGVHPSQVRGRLMEYFFKDDGNLDYASLDLEAALEMSSDEANRRAAAEVPAVFVNPVVAMQSHTEGATDCSEGCDAIVLVEVTDPEGNAITNAMLGIQLGGAVVDSVPAATDGNGIAAIRVTMPTNAPGILTARVAWVRVEGVTTVTPTLATRVDRLSYELISNLGAGLASSSFVLLIDSTSWLTSSYVDSTRVVDSYISRTWGTGLASSSLIMTFTTDFYIESGLAQATLLLRSFGTGLANSSLILDENWFREDLRVDYGLESLFIRHYTIGSGLASSSIIWDGAHYAWNTFYLGYEPAILTMPTGMGLASSSLIWNSFLLNTALFQSTSSYSNWDIPLIGSGLASSSLIMTFDSYSTSLLGFSWDLLNGQLFSGGVGLASSSLILWTNTLTLLDPTYVWMDTLVSYGRAASEPAPYVP